MSGPPPRFCKERRSDTWLMFDADFEQAVRALGLDEPRGLDDALTAGARELGGSPASRGRDVTTLLPLPGRPERLHLRRVLHGGLLGGLWRGRLAGLGRVERELHTTAELRRRGAPVPRPALALARRSGVLWRASLATVHEEGAVDGLAFLAGHPPPASLRRAARAAGRAVRRLHDLGARHRDLHIKNLLLRPTAPGAEDAIEVLVIDLDRARLGAPPSAARRISELARLLRSLRKRGLLPEVGTRGCAAFFAGYHGGDRGLRCELLTAERARWAIALGRPSA